MRLGLALDLHATPATRDEVSWERLRVQVATAERLGLDIVVLPDHLQYDAAGAGDYAQPNEPVGAWESFTIAAALAASTSSIDIGHSMVNAPYRSPALVAHAASTLAQISGGRYQLGVGSGNTPDYPRLGVTGSNRPARFEDVLAILAGLLRGERVDHDGDHARADGAELLLQDEQTRPPLVVAAAGPRSRRLAARYGDGWNGYVTIDREHAALSTTLADLRAACTEIDRDPATLLVTVDTHVDPLDTAGRRDDTLASLTRLAELGIHEVRCYTVNPPTHASRTEAIEALADLRA